MMDIQKSSDIIAAALSERCLKEEKSAAIRRKYLRELAILLFDVPNGDDTVFEISERFSLLREKFGMLTYGDTAFLSLEIERLFEENAIGFSPSLFSLEEGDLPTSAVYVKNGYSDIAFRNFDTLEGKLRSEYADSFDAACSGVFYGQFSSCILPFKNREGRIMEGIMGLAIKYGLKKSLVSSVGTENGGETLFGLFTRDIPDIGADTLDILFEGSDFSELCEILTATKSLGIEILAAEKLYILGEEKTLISVKGGEDKRFALLIFLTLACRRYDVVGLYKTL